MNLMLRIAAQMLAGGWFGAMLLFAFVVAPTAFRVLPGADVAGQLIGPVLRSIHLFGIGAGLALAAIAWGLDRSRWLILLPLLLAAACAFNEFYVTGQLSNVLPHEMGGPGPAERAARFASLHRLSMVVYTGIGLGAAATLIGHARADRDGTGRWG